MARSIFELSDFISELCTFAKERGFEIKRDKDGVALWPTYDSETGGLGEWFALYVRVRKEQING